MRNRILVVVLALCFALSAMLVSCKSESAATATEAAARTKPYVGSVMREPFHKSTCKWAKKIHTDNLVGYDTKAQAVDDGRRPCKVCNP